jgi:hypothetical protein
VTAAISMEEAETRLSEKQRAKQALCDEIDALTMIVEGFRRLNGHAAELFPETRMHAEPERDDHPVGRSAVREVVSERPGMWALREVVDEVLRRGWASDRKPVEVAVHRMTAAGEARRVRHGVYWFGPEPTEDDGA